MASPPPAGNFELVPVVHGRYPLWLPPMSPTHVSGLTSEHREVLLTSVADAEPDHRIWLPESSVWAFLSALAVTIRFGGSSFTPWAVVWGSIPPTIALIAWFWPARKDLDDETLPFDKARPKLDEATGPA